MFHFGILAVRGGHVLGVLIPASWTHAAGLREDAYHWIAVGIGSAAGIVTMVGLAILLHRRSR